MIRLHSLTKRFGSKTVLNSITVTFESSRTHVLLGSSGCGKSTLLRSIVGLVYPDDGFIEIAGQKVTSATSKIIRPNIGYVIQEGGLFPHLTAFENIALVARTQRWAHERIHKRIVDLSQIAAIDIEHLSRYPKNLSGGQRQRVSLMRALMLDPPVLLLDEPLGALDPIVRTSLQTQLKRIFTELKKTVVLVTHDISEAAIFGDTVTLIEAGSIVQHGSFMDLVRRPSSPFVSEFIRSQKPPDVLREIL